MIPGLFNKFDQELTYFDGCQISQIERGFFTATEIRKLGIRSTVGDTCKCEGTYDTNQCEFRKEFINIYTKANEIETSPIFGLYNFEYWENKFGGEFLNKD